MNHSQPLYRIKILQPAPAFSCQLRINTRHPVLQGHFPGNPVMPGAWLIRSIHETIEKITGEKLIMKEARQVKFLEPVLPPQMSELTITGEITVDGNQDLQVTASILHEQKTFVKFKGVFSC